MMGNNESSPPVFAYGWAYDRKFNWDYAVHNKLTRPLDPDYYLAKKYGIQELNYGMITKEMEEDKKDMEIIRSLAPFLVKNDLERRSGVRLKKLQPFVSGCPYMFSIYDNYNVVYRHKLIGGKEKVLEAAKIIEEAMSVGGRKPKLLWYYYWEYLEVVCTLSVPSRGFAQVRLVGPRHVYVILSDAEHFLQL